MSVHCPLLLSADLELFPKRMWKQRRNPWLYNSGKDYTPFTIRNQGSNYTIHIYEQVSVDKSLARSIIMCVADHLYIPPLIDDDCPM
jgi:hypothetical protein